MLPTPAELHYFSEVASTLNLSRASERLGISQPSLSLAIKRLEHTIGTSLFVRHKHGVTLTQAGKQLLLHSRQLSQYWEDIRSQALASQSEIQGSYTLGCPSTIALHMVAGFLPDLLEKFPRLDIQLKHDLSRKIVEEVINLSIDIGIVANPFRHPDLIIRKLCDDEVTFWVADEKRQIQNITSGQAVLLCNPDLLQTQALLKQIKKKKLHFQRIVNTSSLEVVASLTAKGCGIGILPSRVASAMYPDALHRIPKAPVHKDELCVIYRSENRQVKALDAIIQAIKNNPTFK